MIHPYPTQGQVVRKTGDVYSRTCVTLLVQHPCTPSSDTDRYALRLEAAVYIERFTEPSSSPKLRVL